MPVRLSVIIARANLIFIALPRFICFLFEICTSVCYYGAQTTEDTQPGFVRRLRPGQRRSRRSESNDPMVCDFKMDKGSWCPPAPIPKVDDDSRFAIHFPHDQNGPGESVRSAVATRADPLPRAEIATSIDAVAHT